MKFPVPCRIPDTVRVVWVRVVTVEVSSINILNYVLKVGSTEFVDQLGWSKGE
jgi:hypothetical protein